MLSRVWSAAVRGIEGFLVGVELDLSNGLPSFTTVGLPDNSVREARDRVVSAIRNSGFEFPNRKTTVNLAPAELRKAGTQFDLPIALGILMASGQIQDTDWAGQCCFLGELALDGSVQPVSGILPMAASAKEKGLGKLILARGNQREAAAVGIEAYGVSSLKEAADWVSGARRPEHPELVEEDWQAHGVANFGVYVAARADRVEDLSEVRGQALARRALEITAAGGHNLLMVGPPGTGKSMLARRLPGLLPPLSEEEALEVSRIYSVCGLLTDKRGLVSKRPFRAPHSTISPMALVGGGACCRPGEISLAHRGVLFMDEFPEFPRAHLEMLRQPLENQSLTLSRIRETVEYPADFMFVAAMNPCPCGFQGHPKQPCRCAPYEIARYQRRISGPLLDRMDLRVELAPLPFSQWATKQGYAPEDSACVRERVLRVREISRQRSGCVNARLSARQIREYAGLNPTGWKFMEAAAGKLHLSPRALDRLMRVARTIADLSGESHIRESHLGEALQYRMLH